MRVISRLRRTSQDRPLAELEKIQGMCRLYWPIIAHVLKKVQSKVNALSRPKWLPSLLLPSVRRMIHQGTQRPAARRSTSALISLTKVAHRDGTSQDINQVLATAFRADDYLDCIKDLQARNIDPLSYINGLDKAGSHSSPMPHITDNDLRQVIDGLPTGSDLRKQCIRALSGACGLYRILPASYVFSGKLSEPDRRPSLYSVNFDIWRLTIKKHQDQVFAVKSLRFCGGDPVEKLTEVRTRGRMRDNSIKC